MSQYCLVISHYLHDKIRCINRHPRSFMISLQSASDPPLPSICVTYSSPATCGSLDVWWLFRRSAWNADSSWLILSLQMCDDCSDAVPGMLTAPDLSFPCRCVLQLAALLMPFFLVYERNYVRCSCLPCYNPLRAGPYSFLNPWCPVNRLLMSMKVKKTGFFSLQE